MSSMTGYTRHADSPGVAERLIGLHVPEKHQTRSRDEHCLASPEPGSAIQCTQPRGHAGDHMMDIPSSSSLAQPLDDGGAGA